MLAWVLILGLGSFYCFLDGMLFRCALCTHHVFMIDLFAVVAGCGCKLGCNVFYEDGQHHRCPNPSGTTAKHKQRPKRFPCGRTLLLAGLGESEH